MPKMGRLRKGDGGLRSMSDALFSTSQQRVLGLLFGQPARSFYASELIGLAGGGSGAIQRELLRLELSGLATVRRVGSQKHYQANPDSPLYAELVSIARKTVGLAEPLREALSPLAKEVDAAFVYGSVARNEDTARSDVDLLVLSDTLEYADLYGVLEPLTVRLGRPVNPTVISRQELARRRKAGSAFMKRVLEQPKIWVIGSERELTA